MRRLVVFLCSVSCLLALAQAQISCPSSLWGTIPVVGPGTTIGCNGVGGSGLTVGANTTIGDYFVIGDSVTIGNYVVVGSGCTIGSNAVILDNSLLDNNTMVPSGTTIGPEAPPADPPPPGNNDYVEDWLPVVLIYLFWMGLMAALTFAGVGWWGVRFAVRRHRETDDDGL